MAGRGKVLEYLLRAAAVSGKTGGRPFKDPLKNVFCFPSNAWVAMAGMIEAIRIHRFWTVNCFFCFIPSLLISRIITDVNSSGRASFRLFSPNGFEHLRMKQG